MKTNIVRFVTNVDYFNKGDIIATYKSDTKLKVLSTPRKTRFRKFLRWITFKLYKIPDSYKCKVIINERTI